MKVINYNQPWTFCIVQEEGDKHNLEAGFIQDCLYVGSVGAVTSFLQKYIRINHGIKQQTSEFTYKVKNFQYLQALEDICRVTLPEKIEQTEVSDYTLQKKVLMKKGERVQVVIEGGDIMLLDDQGNVVEAAQGAEVLIKMGVFRVVMQ